MPIAFGNTVRTQPVRVEFALEVGSVDISVEVVEWLDHSRKNVEKFRRRGLVGDLGAAGGNGGVPIRLLLITRTWGGELHPLLILDIRNRGREANTRREESKKRIYARAPPEARRETVGLLTKTYHGSLLCSSCVSCGFSFASDGFALCFYRLHEIG